MPDSSPLPDELHNLEQVLDLLASHAEEHDRVTIDSMMDAVGRRSFGPVVLLVGLITMSPLSGIPSLPSILGITATLLYLVVEGFLI